MNNKKKENFFLQIIADDSSIFWGGKEKELNSQIITWLSEKNMKIRRLKCGLVTAYMASKITSIGLHLRSLDIDIVNTPDLNLIKMIDRCSYIKKLRLSGCKYVTDVGLVKIAKSYDGGSQSLCICDNMNITGSGLIKLLDLCRNIQELVICRSNLNGSSLERIAEFLPDLKSLYL